MAMTNSPWSGLLQELLEAILSKLAPPNIICFRAVCKSWRFAADIYLSSLSYLKTPQVPLLILPQDPGAGDDVIRIFSLVDKKDYKLKDMSEFEQGLCVGSSHGWLVMIDQEANLYLFNPFSRVHLSLPAMGTIPGILSFTKEGENDYSLARVSSSESYESVKELRRYYITKVILSANPSHNNGKVAVFALYYLNPREYFPTIGLAYCYYGDDKWVDLRDNDKYKGHKRYRNITCNSDLFYALTYSGEVEIWDISDSYPSKMAVIEADMPDKISRTVKEQNLEAYYFLVESMGDILLVVKFIKTRFNRASMFQVYKHDFDNDEWVDVESLQDWLLFIGGNHSLSISAHNFPECEPNSIYFSDYCWGVHYGYQTGNIIYPGSNRDDSMFDMGVFNLKGKSVKPFYGSNLRMNEPVPLWMICNP